MSPPFWKVFEEQIGHPVIWKLPRIKGKIDMTSWGHFCDSSKWFEFCSKRSWRIQNLISLYCHDPRYRWPWWESLRDAFNLADVKFSCSEAPAKKPPVITCPIVSVPLSTQFYFSLESGLPFPHFCNSFFFSYLLSFLQTAHIKGKHFDCCHPWSLEPTHWEISRGFSNPVNEIIFTQKEELLSVKYHFIMQLLTFYYSRMLGLSSGL